MSLPRWLLFTVLQNIFIKFFVLWKLLSYNQMQLKLSPFYVQLRPQAYCAFTLSNDLLLFPEAMLLLLQTATLFLCLNDFTAPVLRHFSYDAEWLFVLSSALKLPGNLGLCFLNPCSLSISDLEVSSQPFNLMTFPSLLSTEVDWGKKRNSHKWHSACGLVRVTNPETQLSASTSKTMEFPLLWGF